MHKDYITSIKIPGLYILLNLKREELYDLAFKGFLNLFTNKGELKLEVGTIVTD